MRFHVGELNALTAAVRLFIICHSPIQDTRLSLVQQAKGRGQASDRDTTSLHFSISVSFGWRLERTTLETFPRVLVVGPGAKPFMADDHARAISRYFFFLPRTRRCTPTRVPNETSKHTRNGLLKSTEPRTRPSSRVRPREVGIRLIRCSKVVTRYVGCRPRSTASQVEGTTSVAYCGL